MMEIDFQAIEKKISRARKLSWIFGAVAYTSLFVTLFLTLTLAQMGGRLSVFSQLFFTVRSTDELIEVDSFTNNMAQKDVVTEMVLRNFLNHLYFRIPDKNEMARRWRVGGPLYMMTTPALYQQFVGDDFHAKMEEFGTSFPVDVDVLKVYSAGTKNNWLVDFDLVILTEYGIKRQPLRGSFFVESFPERAVFGNEFSNPIGTTILKYEENPRGS